MVIKAFISCRHLLVWVPPSGALMRAALISGLTRGAGRAAFARAVLESVAYQTADLIEAMRSDGVRPTALRVDGGMVANDWLVQFLSDILNLQIDRPTVLETTALGVAYLAGLQSGVYRDTQEIAEAWAREHAFEPNMSVEQRADLLAGWHKAIERTLIS